MGRLLVIDYGLVRSGLAVTATMQITANPLETIQTKDLLSWLRDYFAKEEVEKVENVNNEEVKEDNKEEVKEQSK